MNKLIIAVKDSKAGYFLAPTLVNTVGEGVRMITDIVNTPDVDWPIVKHPEDFVLYQLGIFNQETGIIDSSDPKVICVGCDCVVKPDSKE